MAKEVNSNLSQIIRRTLIQLIEIEKDAVPTAEGILEPQHKNSITKLHIVAIKIN